MGLTIAQKIIKAHMLSGSMEVGSEVALRIDQTLTQDATGTMAYLEFEAMGIPRVKTELSVAYIDHNTLQSGFENADDHRFIQSAAKKYGLRFSRPGNGICHQVHLERFGKPGKTLIGSDSHTPTGGGIGMLAMGAGGLDVAVAMGGGAYYIRMPKMYKVNLTGKLRPFVTAKDISLEILRILSVKGGVGAIIEWGGPGIKELSVPERATITNMGTELGATTSIFPSDEVTKAFLEAEGRGEDFTPLESDPDAVYDRVIDIDLDTLEEELQKDSINIIRKDTEDALPWIVEENGKKFKIKPDGTVIEKVSVKILDVDGVEHLVAEEDVGNWYGKAVSNYKDNATYRIFYIDFDGDFGDIGTIYLKAEIDKPVSLWLYDIENKVETLVQKMNPKWALKRGQDIENWNSNERAAAWLCVPSRSDKAGNWKNYFETNKAEYVIGSPSLEIYIKSYNQVPHTNSNLIIGCSFADENTTPKVTSPGYIYLVNNTKPLSDSYYKTQDNLLDKTDYKGIYCIDGKYVWLASPNAYLSANVCSVYGTRGCIYSNNYKNTPCINPLISLKSTFTPQISED